jgi:hypothetical protein
MRACASFHRIGAFRRGRRVAYTRRIRNDIRRLTDGGVPCLIADRQDEPNSGEPPMQRAILSALILGLVAGCAAEAEKESTKMSFACQVSKCDCASNVMTLFDSQPVQWKADGTAYCPEDYHLRRLAPAPAKPM